MKSMVNEIEDARIFTALSNLMIAFSGESLRMSLAPGGPLAFTLDKIRHFVDSAKGPCPVGNGFRGIQRGELSTK